MTPVTPLAHAGHVLVDLGVFAGPVVVLLIALVIHTVISRRGRENTP